MVADAGREGKKIVASICCWGEANMKWPYSVHAGLLLALLTLPSLIHELRPWPLYLLAPLTIYALAVAVTPPLRRGVPWSLGRLDGAVLAWAAAIILSSSAALVLWFVLVRPDVGDLTEKIPHVGPLQLLLIGVSFSLANARWRKRFFAACFRSADCGLGAVASGRDSGRTIRRGPHPGISARCGRNGHGVGLRHRPGVLAVQVNRDGGGVHRPCLCRRDDLYPACFAAGILAFGPA